MECLLPHNQAVAVDEHDNIRVPILYVSAPMSNIIRISVYLQLLVILRNETHARLQLVDTLLEFTSRLCSIGQVKAGVVQQVLKPFILISQSRLDSLAIN